MFLEGLLEDNYYTIYIEFIMTCYNIMNMRPPLLLQDRNY